MRIHREGYRSIAVVGVALLLFNVLLGVLLPAGALIVSVPVSMIAWGFFIQFFRNPIRTTPDCANCLIAPADGTIVAIETAYENEYFKTECLKISIYMSALNVHVNRVPVSGKAVYTKYHPGKYLVAFHPKASELNERNTVVIETPAGTPVLVRQIAGLLARRIVCYIVPGQNLNIGEELGFIKFGSRCDIFIPTGFQVLVKMDQRVVGGETILASLT